MSALTRRSVHYVPLRRLVIVIIIIIIGAAQASKQASECDTLAVAAASMRDQYDWSRDDDRYRYQTLLLAWSIAPTG